MTRSESRRLKTSPFETDTLGSTGADGSETGDASFNTVFLLEMRSQAEFDFRATLLMPCLTTVGYLIG